MKVYIDAEFKCHVANNGSMAEIDSVFFDGKCDAFIEGYRFVPAGESWTRSDGEVFHGEMIAPWKPFLELEAAQREYEYKELSDMREALKQLEVRLNG